MPTFRGLDMKALLYALPLTAFLGITATVSLRPTTFAQIN
jgi:hypothetical protein